MEIDANTIMLNSSEPSRTRQLWAVVWTFHMGEFVKGLLEERHINAASVAKEMGVKPTSFPSYFRSAVISDDVLIRMTNALKWDLYGLVKAEQARRMVGPPIGEPSSDIAEPTVQYKARPVAANDKGLVLMLNMDDYPEDVQLKILRFLQQQPRRTGSKVQVG